MLVEIIVTSLNEALLAQEYGADRLELIHSFEDGGLSPEPELIKQVCAAVAIPVSVMVRPHAQSFVYDQKTMTQIEQEIDFILSVTQAANIVFGSLNDSNEIDFNQLEKILAQVAKSSVGVTFHRAIDVAKDTVAAFKALQNYRGTNLQRVLSSGGKPTAQEGVNELIAMECEANSGVKLLVGSGVKPSNARQLIELIGCQEIHLGTGVRNSDGKLDKDLFLQLRQVLA